MRLLFYVLLAANCLATQAQAEEPTFFQKQLVAYMTASGSSFPTELVQQYRGRTLLVTFSLDRNGKLLASRIAKGFGSAKMDQETLEWLARLQPFPAIPADDKAPQEITLPLQFGPPPGVHSYEEGERKIKQMMGNICKGC